MSNADSEIGDFCSVMDFSPWGHPRLDFPGTILVRIRDHAKEFGGTRAFEDYLSSGVLQSAVHVYLASLGPVNHGRKVPSPTTEGIVVLIETVPEREDEWVSFVQKYADKSTPLELLSTLPQLHGH